MVDLTFAIWIVVIPLLFHGLLLNSDGDLPRHIVTGGHILAAGPRFPDPFSFTRAGESFLAYEWLSQVVLAGVHAAAGLPGIVLLAASMLAGTFALVTRFVRRAGDPLLAFMTGIAAALLTYWHWLARPHLVTFLALALLLHILHSRRPLVWLVVLFAVWANLHPGFLYGLAMVGIWSVGHAMDDVVGGSRVAAAAAKRGVMPAVAAVATLANPFGWSLHVHALQHVGSDTARMVNEFMPLDPTSALGIMFLLLLGAVVAGLAAHREWVGWHVLLVLGAAVFAAMVGSRNAPVFAVFALPIAAHALAPVATGLPGRRLGRMRAEFARSDRPGARAGMAAAALMLIFLPVNARLPGVSILPREFSEHVFPAHAVQAAREAGVTGRLLSEYTWGGYVLLMWPGQRVFVDSMVDFFGEDLMREYLAFRSASSGWESRLRERDVSVVLLRPDAPLAEQLRRDPGWQTVHTDDVAVLLVRQTP